MHCLTNFSPIVVCSSCSIFATHVQDFTNEYQFIIGVLSYIDKEIQ